MFTGAFTTIGPAGCMDCHDSGLSPALQYSIRDILKWQGAQMSHVGFALQQLA